MKNTLILSILLGALLASGCSIFKPQKDNSIFYTFCGHTQSCRESLDQIGGSPAVINLVIDEIPAYADCPYVIKKSEQNKIFFSEIHRWAEPFEDSCIRAIHDRLSDAMRGNAVIVSSMHAIGNVFTCDYRLSIDFDDLVYNADEKVVVLRCSWSLFDHVARERLILRKYENSTAIDGEETYENIVETIRLALIALTDDMAERIRRIELRADSGDG
jgi:uncharacterized lipoprotein YmbA